MAESLEPFDSDDEFITEDDSQIKESLHNRLDQYLTASQLGRLAYKAGDIQLATDRFNLALDIELQVELESFNDFGVTGEILRQELEKRVGFQPTQKDDESLYSKVLPKLQNLYDRADFAAAMNPSQSKWYIQMGGALCLLNEWEKARKIYEEGLRHNPQDLSLQTALHRLNKVDDLMKLLGECKVSNDSSITLRRPSSTSQSDDETDGNVPRSRSFTQDNIKKKRKVNHRTMSPLARMSLLSESPLEIGTVSVSPTRKRASVFNIFRKNKSITASHSYEDLAKSSKQEYRERSAWKSLFTTSVCSLQLSESSLGSRTIQSMRAINALTDTS